MRTKEPVKWSEAAIISRLASAFEWHRRTCCPNVCEGSEMDFAMLTESGYLWECEVKISMADWKADLAKTRHYLDGWSPARFYYAVPWTLAVDGIPTFVPAHAGILVFDDVRGRSAGPGIAAHEPSYPRWLRQAKALHKVKAGPQVRTAMLHKIYHRYWRHVAPAQAKSQPAMIEIPQVEPATSLPMKLDRLDRALAVFKGKGEDPDDPKTWRVAFGDSLVNQGTHIQEISREEAEAAYREMLIRRRDAHPIIPAENA